MKKPPKITDRVQIGKTAEGEPIWIEPKDLISTPEEDAERRAKTLDSQQQAMVDKAAHLVLETAGTFIHSTIAETASKNFIGKVFSVPDRSAEGLLFGAGYEVVQDGATTVVMFKGKVLRILTADIPVQWREHVCKRVDQIVRGVNA